MIVNNEKEALLLENTLIKQHQPRFNVKLVDDKNYLVLRLDPKARYPRLEVTRRIGKDSAKYFGPYHSATSCRATLAVVNGYWHLAHANDVPSVVGQVAYKATERTSVKETILYGPHQANTALEFWRFFSDSIVEWKGGHITAAFEYQLGSEGVDVSGKPTALWTAAQAPIHWASGGPWSVTVRPEFCWDRDGRWIGGEQSVKAFTTTLEYRMKKLGIEREHLAARRPT
jgi:hypothetical protein